MPETTIIAAITEGANVPASRFRVRQYIEPLAGAGFIVQEHIPLVGRYSRLPGVMGRVRPRHLGPLGLALVAGKLLSRVPGIVHSWNADIVWLQRELSPLLNLEKALGSPLLFDIDDAIWLDRPMVGKIARRADTILAGNSFIAEWAGSFCTSVHVVPTAIDTARFHPREKRREDDSFVIGWTGTSANLRYLYSIEQALARFLENCPDARLRILCDSPPDFRRIAQDHVEYVRWSPATEVRTVQGFDVGIMPLEDTEWERGKCGFKMLQYMATGLPVIVSPVGVNREILGRGEVGIGAASLSDWLDAMVELHCNPSLRSRMGRTGRAVVERSYSTDVVGQQLIDIFSRFR